MDSARKLEILEAEARFRRRTALQARLAECGIYLIGPLGDPSAGDERPWADPSDRVESSSQDMLAEAENRTPGLKR